MALIRLFAFLLAVGVVSACSPTFGWEPKTLPELVTAAPIVARIKIISVSGSPLETQTAAATVKCVLKNTSGAPLAKKISITGFGDPSMCLMEAVVGDTRLAFLTAVNVDTTPPTYALVYSDMLAGTYPDTQDNVATAKLAVAPGETEKKDFKC